MSEDYSRDKLEWMLSEPTNGRSFLEKLLIALIDAHPVEDGRSREDRIKAAMLAIRGEHHSLGQKLIDDHQLLLWMAEQYYRDQCAIPTSIDKRPKVGDFHPDSEHPNPTALARAALVQFDAWETSVSKRAQTQRLIDKFRKKLKLLIAEYHLAAPDPHYAEHYILERTADDFELVGVPFALPEDPTPFP